ncbi:9504_t:CDS:10 [Entrophospora sp. SA101]|nr:9504_t:CDS:10 [Entrophospora sp. SA101]
MSFDQTNVEYVGYRKLSFTCSTEELQTFITSAAPLIPFSSLPLRTEKDLRDAVINNYISLIDSGIPCLWRYSEGTNLEHIYNHGEITRELWVFWLGSDVPAVLADLYKKEDFVHHCDGTISFDNYDRELEAYGLFVSAMKNITNRSLIKMGALPVGEWCTFPTKTQDLYDRHDKNLYLELDEISILLAPSGITASLLPIKKYKEEDANAITDDFERLFSIKLSTLDCTDLPQIMDVKITHDNIIKEFPYPTQCIYVISELNMGYQRGISDVGTAPQFWNNKKTELYNTDWWNYKDPTREAQKTLLQRNHIDHNGQSPSGVETSMTPNTPGLANNATSNVNSPGHNNLSSPSSSRTKKRSSGETKASYPSPPDLQASSSSSNDLLPLNDEYGMMDEVFGYDVDIIEQEITEDDFEMFDTMNEPKKITTQPVNTTHNLTATISITTVTTAASTELSNNMVIETPQIPKEKLIHQKILKDLEFVTERNPLVPDEWAPLKFNNPDNHKFQPGGSYWTVVNDKKRKRSFTYTPDYKPQHLQAKKPRLEKDDYSTDSSIDFNDRAETNLQDCDRSSRNLGFVNSARFMSVIATLSLFALALDSLRDQVALGSYPFGVGLKGEGESISELVDSKQRLMQALKGELPVASALPCEIDDVTNSFKEVVNDVCKKLPKSETLKEITVKGPLTLNAYCDLIGTEYLNKGEGEVPLSFLEELPTPDITVAATEGSNEYLIDCSPEIIQYWDKHNIIPYDGKKNIRYYVLYPDNEHLRDYVKSFFDRLSIHYEMCSLGSHKSAEMNGTFHGLIPIFLNQPVLGESELNRRIKSYEDRFSIFGKKYLTKMIDPYQNEHIVIYIVNPFNHSSANYDVMYSFVRLIMEFKKELGSRLNQKIIDKIIPQIVPAEHIITYGETIFNTAHDKQLLQQLAFSNYKVPFVLPKPDVIDVKFQSYKEVMQQKLINKQTSPLKYDTVLHMSYGYSIDQKIIFVVWIDTEGKNYGSTSITTHFDKERQTIDTEFSLKEAWKRTHEFWGKSGKHRRIIITKAGEMSKEEVNIWINLTEGKYAIFCMNIESKLKFCPQTSKDDYRKVCGLTLKHPIPLYDFKPLASGYILEVNRNECLSNGVQVDLVYNPSDAGNDNETLWECVQHFHQLVYMEVSPKKTTLPFHILTIERLIRTFVGVSL